MNALEEVAEHDWKLERDTRKVDHQKGVLESRLVSRIVAPRRGRRDPSALVSRVPPPSASERSPPCSGVRSCSLFLSLNSGR